MNTELLRRLNIAQVDIADRLHLDPSTVSLKVKGERHWKRHEIDALLALARERDATITYEQLFAAGEEQKAEAIA